MCNELEAAILTTAIMTLFYYCLTKLWLWGLTRFSDATEWWRGFGWGCFFWAGVGRYVYDTIKLAFWHP